MSAPANSRNFCTDASEPLKILVLEDELFDRIRFARWVRAAAGARVKMSSAATLAEFRTALLKERYTMVVIDFALSDGDGFDAL